VVSVPKSEQVGKAGEGRPVVSVPKLEQASLVVSVPKLEHTGLVPEL
jgi:hypothetical protein